ncbi:MAG TPA: hypothetical protein VEB66_02275 [Opitutaceae bacterium]|nr:hypothetical protein [Opitutaceae bacterium]
MKTRLVILFAAALALAGCANYKGLIPEKNVHMEGVVIQAGPGGALIKADKIITTMEGQPWPDVKPEEKPAN